MKSSKGRGGAIAMIGIMRQGIEHQASILVTAASTLFRVGYSFETSFGRSKGVYRVEGWRRGNDPTNPMAECRNQKTGARRSIGLLVVINSKEVNGDEQGPDNG